MMIASYQIKLPQFEGPFDLLLFFIERDELDVYNIPINQIIKDFQNYIHQLEALNIEMASEFILFVATLMRIKSKLLLPRREIDAQGNEIDPRQELVDKLLEYKRFKEISGELSLMEEERKFFVARGNIKQEAHALAEEYSEGTEIQQVTSYKLLKAFEKVMVRFNERLNKPQHVVTKYNYSQDGQRSFLLKQMKGATKTSFDGIFSHCQNRIHAIFTFLAMLELIQQGFLSIATGVGRNNFIVETGNQFSQIEDSI